MAADVYAQHLLFKVEKLVLRIFPDVWKRHLEVLFFFLGHEIKHRHLPFHGILLFFVLLIKKLRGYQEFLFSRSRKRIHGPGLDKTLQCSLIYLFAAHPVHEIFQGFKFSPFPALLHYLLHNGLADALDCGKAVADGTA